MYSSLDEALRHILKRAFVEALREVSPSGAGYSCSAKPEAVKEPVLWRAKETAEALQISDKQLYRLTKAGKLSCVRINKSVRYDPDVVRAWISSPEADRILADDRAGVRTVAPVEAEKIARGAEKAPSKSTKRPATPKRRSSAAAKPLRAAVDKKHEAPASGQPRTVRNLMAERLGVSPDTLPELTNGEIMRIAGVDNAALWRWKYRNGDLPDEAIQKLREYYAALVSGAVTRQSV